jgi:superkiller protein 3
MTKLQPSSLLTAAVLGLVFFNPGNALAIAAIRPNVPTHPASTPSFMTQASADEYLEQGIRLFQSGDFQGAEAAFRKAIQLNPNDAEAHNILGIVLFVQQGKLEEAITEFRQTIRIDPNDANAHKNLGAALYRQDKLEEAIAELKLARVLFIAQGKTQEVSQIDQWLRAMNAQ